MGTWSVKLQKMKDVIEEEYTFSGQLEGWSEEIDGIRRGIDFHGAGRERVISCLLALSSKASEEGSKMQKLGDRLNEISNAYRISEDKIYYNVVTYQNRCQKEDLSKINRVDPGNAGKPRNIKGFRGILFLRKALCDINYEKKAEILCSIKVKLENPTLRHRKG